jgi:hypothetical protein
MRGDVACDRRRQAADNDDDLAADIDPGIIVDSEPFLAYAPACEHQLGVDGAVGLLETRAQPEVAAVDQVMGLSSHCESRARGGLVGCSSKRHLLVPASVDPPGLKADGPKLGCDISGSQIVAARAGVAAFEKVAGKEFDIGLEPLRRGFLWFRGCRRKQ